MKEKIEKLNNKNQFNQRFEVKLTNEQKAQLQKHSSAIGVKMTDYVRYCIVNQLKNDGVDL